MAHDSPDQLITPPNHADKQSLRKWHSVSCDWLEPGFCGAFFFFLCRMQFKHTLGLQDFMNRTENQEQSRAKKRERGKRGNEIVARERRGDGEEKRKEH